MSNRTYKINEIFYSLQGEGGFTGCPAIFIRFSGCNLKCPFCDTKHNEGRFMTLSEIGDEVRKYSEKCPFVILTGGEPTLFADDVFLDYLKGALHVAVAVETNGTREVSDKFDWVTVSPKTDFVDEPAEVKCKMASEVKVVYDGVHNPEHWLTEIKAADYYLQPCDVGNPEDNARIMAEAVQYCLDHPRWRISLQTQKILKVR